METNAPYTRKRPRPEDWKDILPSKVVHIRDLCEHTLEIDIARVLEKFGGIRDIAMIPKKRQALVEFEDISSAQDVVRMYRNDLLYVANKPAKVNFSTSEHVVKRTGAQSESVSSANKILVFFIYENIYPITVDVIITICKPHGRVVRIFINRKGQVLQALVEFNSVEEAVRVKRNLNGADIYSGCCTLKIEFATITRVNVGPNSDDCWDSENPIVSPSSKTQNSLLELPSANRPAQQRLSLLSQANNIDLVRRAIGAFEQEFNMDTSSYEDVTMTDTTRVMGGYPPSFHGSTQHQNGGDMITHSTGSCVAMVYGLNLQRLNCDKLFNLLCIYGNILKIKFLKSKEGSAMVEMSDQISLNRMMSLLHNQTLFGQTLQLQTSKQAAIMNVPVPYQLPDGTVSFKDYTASRENRFLNPQSADKNRVFPPSMTVNYWNAPPHFSFDLIKVEFGKMDTVLPTEFFQLTDRDKSSSGLLQWTSAEDATNAIALCNHILISSVASKYPYQLKLSFSESAIRHGHAKTNATPEADGSFPSHKGGRRGMSVGMSR